MADPTPKPDTINKLRFGADAAFAMLAGMQLDIFTPLKDGPQSAREIAKTLGVSADRLRLLLYCLVAAGLLTENDGRFANTPEANHFLVKGRSSYMGNLHADFAQQWPWKLKTAESLRTGVPQAKINFSSAPAEQLESFLRRINSHTVAATRSLLARQDFSSVKTLADVGCGGAGLALTMANACPHLQISAIDLPLIAPIAKKLVDEEGMAEKVAVLTADVLRGPLSGSYDTAILRALLQVLSPSDARLALKNIAPAINPGGMIFIIGQILDNSHTSPPEAVWFNLNFLNVFDGGESYTEKEHREWLADAGFIDIERSETPLAQGLGLITARKPE